MNLTGKVPFVYAFLLRITMVKSKSWDWSKNKSNEWLIPMVEAPYLCQRWQQSGFIKFLDLGCGLGRHSIFFAENEFNVFSMDLSDYGINHLKNWAEKENLNLNYHVGDMLSLPYESNFFDCIMAYNVIYHTDTQGLIKTIDEIKRILKPGGELFITLISKRTWSWQNKEKYKQIDDNTILRDEDETEKNVPHLFVDIDDIREFFKDFEFVLSPKECTEYDVENSGYRSTHFELLLKKND